MIEIDIPGRCVYRLGHLLLDLNGTLSWDGTLIDGVPERIEALRGRIDIAIVTADTLGKGQSLGKRLRVSTRKIDGGNEEAQKAKLVRQLGRKAVVAIGNGANDAAMMKEAMLGICVVDPEGAASEALANCDLAVTHINAALALELLLKQERLIATLRR